MLFISDIVKIEIENTPDDLLRDEMLEIASQFDSLNSTEEIELLAKEYIRHNAVPRKYSEDAYHIALATVNEMDCLASWNFKHIVRRKTKDIVRMVNAINNYKEISIFTPAELI